MRRIVKALALLGAAALTACTGSGSVINTGSLAPQLTIIQVQGQTNLPRVLAGASIPLSATSVNGSQNGTLNTNRYIWSAVLTSGLTYNFTTDGNQQRACANVNITTGGTTTPYVTDFSVYIAIDPTNESNIIFTAPTSVPAPTGSTVATNYPYCVTISATPLTGSATSPTMVPSAAGSITVVVLSPTAPLG